MTIVMNPRLKTEACPWRYAANGTGWFRGYDDASGTIGCMTSAPRRDRDRAPRGCNTPEGVQTMNALRGSRLPAATPSIQLERAVTVAPSPECLDPRLLYQAPIPGCPPGASEDGSLLGASL